MKKVTVFVPIDMYIKGENKLAEVHDQLHHLNKIVSMSELQSSPNLQVELVGNTEIIDDTEK